MEARYKGVCLALLALCSVAAAERPRTFQDRTRNFVVNAPTPEIAKQVAQQAEVYRHKLAVEWLGKPLPAWRSPCVVNVTVGQIGAGGATTFVFTGNAVSDYKMNIQGPLDRIIDSVLPHEVNHTIFAEHFRRPMPRWADEGAATFVEDESERRRQMLLAMQVLRTNRRIPLRNLLSIMDYPKDMQDVLHLYAEGYVLVELLIQNGGRAKFLKFLNAANIDGWDRALDAFYGQRGIDGMEGHWNQWVLAGCPAKAAPEGTMVAAVDANSMNGQAANVLTRSQAPEREDVSLEGEAVTESVATVIPQAPRRGTTLNAPLPARRSGEPPMLNQVNLGTESKFRNERSRPAAARNTNSELSRPERLSREVAQADFAHQEEEFEVDEEAAPVARSPRAVRPVASRSHSGRPLPQGRAMVTPVVKPDTRPQYGQAQPFPKNDVDFVADVAG